MAEAPGKPIDDDLLLDLVPTHLDTLIDALDRRIGEQLDEILHHPAFQKLERVWRGLWFVIDRTQFDENIQIELLDCSKEDLRADLSKGSTPIDGGFASWVYKKAIGAGIVPYGAIITTYEFGPEAEDVQLLRQCAYVAIYVLAPFIAAASPRFFGVESYADLPRLTDVAAALTQHTTEAFTELRSTEDARALGLVLPRFLLRAAFVCEPSRGASFAYRERVDEHEHACWGNAAFAFATRLTDSFARYRWCPNIIGENAGGLLEALAQREDPTAPSTEVPFNERKDAILSEQGLIPLCSSSPGEACFYSANSLQKPKYFGTSKEGRAAELNFRLGTQLPYFFIISRVVQYLKVVYRSYRLASETRADAERELNDWVGQYVADRDVVSSSMRGRRPLRKAVVTVDSLENQDEWYKLQMRVRPHFKYMGAFFTLSLVNHLDRDDPSHHE